MAENIISLPAIIAFMIVSIVGVIGNLTILLVTFTNKTLQTRCCILIGIMAFFDFIVCVYVTQLRIMMLLGFYNISSTTCFLFSFYGVFAMNMQSILSLFIGLDRLYKVSFPVKYSKLPLAHYIIGFVFCILVSLLVTFSKYVFMAEEIIIPVCLPVTALNQTSLKIWLAFNFLISISVIIIYTWTHIKCNRMKKNNLHIKTVESVNRILSSLIVIIAFYVCTWFSAVAVLFFAEVLKLEGGTVYIVRKVSGYLVVCNSSLHGFIYFWRTPDYRNAIIQLFRHPFKSESNKSSKILISAIPRNQVRVL